MPLWDTAEERGPEKVYRVERAPPLVREVFEAKGYREYDEEEDGDEWHMFWKCGRFKPSEYAAANRGQRVNHYPKTTGITKKDTLLRNLRRMRGIHGQVFAFFPESYILPTEYLTLVRACEAHPPDEQPVWIVKPTDSSQGRKIFLIRDISEISYGHFSASMSAEALLAEDELSSRQASSRSMLGASSRSLGGGGGGGRDSGRELSVREQESERARQPGGYKGGVPEDQRVDERGRAIMSAVDMSMTLKMLKSRLKKEVTPCVKFTEMHVVQRYVDRPLCFSGYKLDLRIYVLLLSAQPLRVYWYRDCLVRFATHKYDMSDIDNQYAHLTNTSINKNSGASGVGGCKWSMHRFKREQPDHPLNTPLLWVRIRAIINLTLLSIAADIPDNGGCFELLGYDVIVDEALKPWLLEVNTSPALGVECDVDRQVKEPLLSDLVDLVNLQQEQQEAAPHPAECPVGGGAAAARARRRPSTPTTLTGTQPTGAPAGAAAADGSGGRGASSAGGSASGSARGSATSGSASGSRSPGPHAEPTFSEMVRRHGGKGGAPGDGGAAARGRLGLGPPEGGGGRGGGKGGGEGDGKGGDRGGKGGKGAAGAAQLLGRASPGPSTGASASPGASAGASGSGGASAATLSSSGAGGRGRGGGRGGAGPLVRGVRGVRGAGGSGPGGPGPPSAMRARQAAVEEVQRLPATCGGYELIFPTTPLTEKLAGCVGGNEAQIVAEIKAELQSAMGHSSAAPGNTNAAAPRRASTPGQSQGRAPPQSSEFRARAAPPRAPVTPTGAAALAALASLRRTVTPEARPNVAYGRDEAPTRRRSTGYQP